MKKIIAILASSFALNNLHAIPVYDHAAAVANAKQLSETINQIQQMKAQVEQAKLLYTSLNGTRGVVDLLNNPVVLNGLPKNYQEIYNGIANAKSGKWASLYKLSNNYKQATQQNLKEAYEKSLSDYDKYVEKAFDDTSKRLETLNSLTSKINQTKDAKEIADLQARISAEQAGIALDKTRLDMLREIKILKKEMLQQNASNKWHENLKKPFKMPDIHVDIKKPFGNN